MPGVVPLAWVYDALDADAYRAYRAAMRRSRGGVVRAADLLAGLAECYPEVTAAALAVDPVMVSRLARPPAREPDLVPMANSPSLRQALAAAYDRTAGRSITPADLLAVLVPAQPAPAPAALQEEARASVSRPAPFSAAPGPAEWTGEDAAAVLARWLAAQQLPSAERDAELQRIARNPGGEGRSLV